MNALIRVLTLTSLFLAAFQIAPRPAAAAEGFSGGHADSPGTPSGLAALAPDGLPEGFHDGAAGTVDAASCGAFGWAVDPDNRSRDLQVQILSDGSPVATATADLLREDVGACQDGTCGFGVNLWGLISPGVEHQITAQAFDEETDTWVNLSETPKTLTCFGFPEGFHDGSQGTVDQYSCNANGWAVDPDNRDRDVDVRVLSDGNEVASVPAHIYRQDMDNLGICPGGTCSWFVDLWGLISHDAEHQIKAEVFDPETAGWLALASTPKTLTCASPPPPSPWLIAFPENEAVEGWEWPDGATVYLTVDDLTTARSPDYSDQGVMAVTTWEDPRTYLRLEFAGLYDLKPGDVVTVTDGATPRTHVVQDLAVTGVDEAADTVAGTADPGTMVEVWPHEGGPLRVKPFAGDDGTWLAAFAGLYDIVPGTGGRSQIVDGAGNATAVDWSVPVPPSPWLLAFPEFEMVQGWEWPMEVGVHLEIDDPSTDASPDYQADGTTAPTPWGDPRSYVEFAFGGAYDLKAGDIVTLTDGTSPQTHVVRTLSVLEVDISADTIAGSTGAGADVVLWPHEFDQTATVQTTAGDDGAWLADFSELFDLVGGTAGRAQAPDEFGNATAVDWRAPLTRLTIFLDRPFIEGYEWPDGATVTVAVADKEACTSSAVAASPEWDPQNTFFWIEFPSGCLIVPGDVVTMTDGDLTITHVVQDLAVTEVSVETETVSGTADYDPSAYELHGWINGFDTSFVTPVAEGGAFAVDFGSMGFDLQPGMSGRMELTDGASNSTAYDWRIPDPRFTAFPEWEWFDGYDWPDGATVAITVEGKPECDTTAESVDWFFNGSFGDGCDITVGDEVTFTSGETVKSHLVQNLSVANVKVMADTVSGRADKGALVHVWPHETGQEVEVTASRTGHWMADFSDLYDIVPFSEGRSEIRDDDGDATAVDWAAGFAPPKGTLQWIVAYTYDLPTGTLAPGSYPYHFDFEWTTPEQGSWSDQEGVLDVSEKAPMTDGYALLRGPMELGRQVGRGGLACTEVQSIHPSQPARFLIGWLTDRAMTYPEARAFFESLTGSVVWGEEEESSGALVPHEIRPWRGDVDDWFKYVCTFTRR